MNTLEKLEAKVSDRMPLRFKPASFREIEEQAQELETEFKGEGKRLLQDMITTARGIRATKHATFSEIEHLENNALALRMMVSPKVGKAQKAVERLEKTILEAEASAFETTVEEGVVLHDERESTLLQLGRTEALLQFEQNATLRLVLKQVRQLAKDAKGVKEHDAEGVAQLEKEVMIVVSLVNEMVESQPTDELAHQILSLERAVRAKRGKNFLRGELREIQREVEALCSVEKENQFAEKVRGAEKQFYAHAVAYLWNDYERVLAGDEKRLSTMQRFAEDFGFERSAAKLQNIVEKGVTRARLAALGEALVLEKKARGVPRFVDVEHVREAAKKIQHDEYAGFELVLSLDEVVAMIEEGSEDFVFFVPRCKALAEKAGLLTEKPSPHLALDVKREAFVLCDSLQSLARDEGVFAALRAVKERKNSRALEEIEEWKRAYNKLRVEASQLEMGAVPNKQRIISKLAAAENGDELALKEAAMLLRSAGSSEQKRVVESARRLRNGLVRFGAWMRTSDVLVQRAVKNFVIVAENLVPRPAKEKRFMSFKDAAELREMLVDMRGSIGEASAVELREFHEQLGVVEKGLESSVVVDSEALDELEELLERVLEALPRDSRLFGSREALEQSLRVLRAC